MINIPILFTLSRIIITPVIVACLYYQYWWLALVLLAVAGVTDMLDGYLARAWKQETLLGACLDPIADKFLLLTLYVSSLLLVVPQFQLPVWFVVLAVVREAIILVGAAYLGLKKHKVSIQPTYLSKVTTVAQLIFVAMLFLSAATHYPPGYLGNAFLVVLTCMLVLSGLQYIVIGRNSFGRRA